MASGFQTSQATELLNATTDSTFTATPKIGLIFECIIIPTNIYLGICFVMHGRNAKMMKSRSRSDMHRGLVYKIALAAVWLPFIRYSGSVAFSTVGDLLSDNACEVAADIADAGLLLGLLPNYAFLWARQRAFYGHPSLSGRYGRILAFVSKFILVPILLLGIVCVVVAFYPVEYQSEHGLCGLRRSDNELDYRVFLYAALMILCQFVLVGLFLHPIVSHMKSKQRLKDRRASDASSADYTLSSASQRLAVTVDDEGGTEDSSPIASKTETVIHANEIQSFTEGSTENPTVQESEGAIVDSSSQKLDNSLSVKALCNAHPDGRSPRSNRYVDRVRGSRPSREDISDLESDVGSRRGSKDRKKSLGVVENLRRKGNTVRSHLKRTRKTMKERGKVVDLIKKILLLALVAICSDLFVMVINFVLSENIPLAMQFVVYDISLLVNVTTVIASFENFGKTLTGPWQYCKKILK